MNKIQTRYHQVRQMRSNFAIENMQPDLIDIAYQEAYALGKINIENMLKYARDFAFKHSRKH